METNVTNKVSSLLFYYSRLLLAFNAATCAGPAKLKGRGLHDLDSEEHLACAPLVTVPQYSVPVTKGGHALLPCRLEEGEAAEVTWLREGVSILFEYQKSIIKFDSNRPLGTSKYSDTFFPLF